MSIILPDIYQYWWSYKSGIVRINGVKYISSEIRLNIPYIIEYNTDTRDYYMINREYSYMGYDNIKTLDKLGEDDSKFIRIGLYGDGSKPWNGKKHLLNYLQQYLSIIKTLNKCKNYVPFFDFMETPPS